MGKIAKAIATCAYNAAIPVATFRYNNWRVIVNKQDVMVKDIEKEADAAEVISYLKELAEKG